MSIYTDSRRGPGVFTRSGAIVYPLDPTPESIDISDICYHLAYINRFNGAAGYINVLSHSLNCYDYAQGAGADDQTCLAVLLHDAAEYVLGDIIRPLKSTSIGGIYDPLENRLATMIFDKYFGEGHPVKWDSPVIKRIDDKMLAIEIDLFLPQCEMPPGLPAPLGPDVFTYENYKPGFAKFRFAEICKQRGFM